MPLDSRSLGAALNETLTLHSALCRREAGAFEVALKTGDDLVVACTQERRLFTELAVGANSTAPIRFVNIRETGGWSRDAAKASPKSRPCWLQPICPTPSRWPRSPTKVQDAC